MVDQKDVAPLSGNSPSKSVVENMGSENQVEESFEEGDGGEIMVEIVGSDVYVDGVSGDKEGKIEESEIHNVSEDKVRESVAGPSESKGEKHFVAREEVGITLSKSVDVKGDVVSALPPSGISVVNDGVWNPGIAATVSNSDIVGASPMVILEEKITEGEAVTKDGPTEAVLDEKTVVEEKKDILLSSDNTASHDQSSSAVPAPNPEVVEASPMVIDEEKTTEAKAVTEDGPTEAALIEKTEVEEKKKVLPSSDNTASDDQSSSEVTVANTDVTGASPMVIDEEKITGAEAVAKDGATSESLDCTTEAVIDKKTEIEEKKEVLSSGDSTASGLKKCSSAVPVSNSEVTEASPMVIVEEKITEAEAITKDGTTSEKTEIEEEDSTAIGLQKCSSAVPVSNSEVTEASPMVIVEEKITEAEAVTKDGTTSEKTEVEEEDSTARGLKKCSSAVPVSNSEVTEVSPMVIVEEKITEAEAVTKDGSTSEKTEVEDEKEVLPSTDDSAKCVATDEVKGLSPAVMSEEEKSTEDEAVTKECADSETLAALNHPEETDLDDKTDIEEKNDVLPSTDDSAKCAATNEVKGSSPVVTSEEKSTENEGATKGCADLVTPEPSNHPKETFLDEKTVFEEKKDVLPSTDDSAKCVATDEVTGPSPMVISEEKGTEDEAVTKACTDIVTSEPLNHPEETDLDEKTDIDDSANCAASDEVTGPSPVVISESKSIEDEAVNKDSAELVTPEPMSHPGEAVSEIADIEEEKKEVLPSSDNSANRDHVDADSVVSHEETKAAQGGVEPPKVTLNSNGEGMQVDGIASVVESGDRVDGVSHTGSESIHECSSASDGGEAKDNGECLGTVANENKLAGSGVTDVIDSDKSLNVEVQEGKIENEQPVAITLDAEIDGQDAVISQPEVVDGEEKSCEKVEEIKSEISAVDDSAENMQIVEEGTCSKVEEDLMDVEDHAVGHDAIANSEECGTKQEVSEQITETSNHEVGKIENIDSMPNEVASIAPVPEKAGSVEEITSLENKASEEDHEPRECNGFGNLEDYTSETKMDADLAAEGPSETEKSKLKPTSSFRMSQSGYLTPPEKEGNFAQSDLVWGKVRSHPWWPGQIFDPDDASEKAVKYHKKDAYLVAYFGDQTFAWNDSSALKPFRSHFTQIEKQSSSEAFHNAVTCALEEVERRVELGLACSCIPKDAYAKIETQFVENTGIREEASLRFGVDQSSQASHFEPIKLLNYITGLAPRSSSRADRLDLVIARAQLSAFFRFKGYRPLTEFPLSGELLESDVDTEKVTASHKRKHAPKDGSQSERSLVGDREYSPDVEDEFGADDVGKSVGKKRKALDPLAEGSEKRITVYSAKVSTSANQAPKPSFKIGECIRRVASQLTGSTPAIKDETVIDGAVNSNEQSEKVVVSVESLSVSEMLSRIELVALDPKKKHSFHNNLRAFFLGFRSSVAINRRGRKKKSEQTVGGSGEEFEFDDVNDSYWTDRIVQNYPDGQLPHEGENGTPNLHLVPFTGEKPVKTGRKPHSRKRFSSAVSLIAPTVEDEKAKRRKQESSPAELILNFAERNRIPSEINLNKMFRRFGPLMESETEVDHESGCAKVIFKRGSDAEVALNSAEKFSIFGPVLVNYQIGYSPVISVKILPVAMPQPQEDQALMA